MGVYHVQQHRDAHAVGLVHEVFEILGVPEAAGGGKEVRHLIAEGAVIRVLHDRHELHGVVPEVLHPRQHVVGKLPVGADAVFLGGHAHVSLIDEQVRVGLEFFVRPGVGRDGVPDLTDPLIALGVLNDAPCVERNVPGDGAAVSHDGLDAHAVPERVLGKLYLPVAV